nr:uncharacterized protein LOC113401253 [Vanessa tameamea]
MLRWMCGVMRADRIRNSYIRGSLRVRDEVDKLQKRRLRCYDHVARRPKDYVGRKYFDIFVPGRFPGRPRKRWLDVVKQDMRANGLPQDDVKDCAKWTTPLSQKADPGNSWD